MFLSFITLAAIPAFAITDKGYVDVAEQKQTESHAILSFYPFDYREIHPKCAILIYGKNIQNKRGKNGANHLGS
jgi:hypothetical protein